MSEPEPVDRIDDRDAEHEIEKRGEPHPAELLVNLLNADAGGRRAASSPSRITEFPLHIGEVVPPPGRSEQTRIEEVEEGARALASPPSSPPSSPESDASGLMRAVQSLRSALPYVQRLLPLLDGNVVTALVNLLAPRPAAQQPPPKPVELGPIESSLAELKTQQREMRRLLLDQSENVKLTAEQLELVRQSTDRNTSELQDLVDELRAASRRVNIVAFLAFALLAGSIALNIFLYLQIHRLLP
jgi:hypothetical protein